MIKKSYGRILAVDGSYLIHRALHQKQIFELRGPNGERSGGVFQFMRSLKSEMAKNPDYFPVVCWDGGLSKRRVHADPFYKHADERNTDPEVLTTEEADTDYLTQYRKQRAKTMEILSYFGVPSLRFTQWEGDDLIYILTTISEVCRVLTDDKDMLQLLSETTSVRRPMANELIEYDKFLEENGYETIHDFVMQKSITGDGSDNIPSSCNGVGNGTAIHLIRALKECSKRNIDFRIPDNVKKLCKDNGMIYRSAFSNFNIERFLINMELVDLKRVKFDQQIYESILATIDSCKNGVNYFACVSVLKSLGINEVSPDEMIQMVSSRYKHLSMRGETL